MAHSRNLDRRSLIFATGSAGLVLSLPSRAQPADDLVEYARETRTVIGNARKLVEPVLTPTELSVARSVRYRVTESNGTNAFAAWEDGRRLIVVHAGMIQVLDWIADALLIDRELGFTGCLPAYSSYLGQGIIDNTARRNQGLPFSLVASPGMYADRFSGPCHGFKLSDFTARPELGNIRARMMEASIMFLYLHELGHHVLNHVPPDMVDDASKAMHRSQEDAADRWAILTALRINYYLSGAVPWIIFVAMLGGNSIESEEQSTHPLGVKRDLQLYNETLSYLQRHPDAWKGSPDDYQATLGNMQKTIDYLNSVLASLP